MIIVSSLPTVFNMSIDFLFVACAHLTEHTQFSDNHYQANHQPSKLSPKQTSNFSEKLPI